MECVVRLRTAVRNLQSRLTWHYVSQCVRLLKQLWQWILLATKTFDCDSENASISRINPQKKIGGNKGLKGKTTTTAANLDIAIYVHNCGHSNAKQVIRWWAYQTFEVPLVCDINLQVCTLQRFKCEQPSHKQLQTDYTDCLSLYMLPFQNPQKHRASRKQANVINTNINWNVVT